MERLNLREENNQRYTNIFKLHNAEEEIYCKPARVSNFWSNNYVEYESHYQLKNILIKSNNI